MHRARPVPRASLPAALLRNRNRIRDRSYRDRGSRSSRMSSSIDSSQAQPRTFSSTIPNRPPPPPPAAPASPPQQQLHDDKPADPSFLRTFGRPISKVALLAILTYQLAYFGWTKLEHDEIRGQMTATISQLEGRVAELERASKP